MRTSIFIGSVTLSATPFEHSGDAYIATYEARVSPWSFWNEHGDITLTVPPAELAQLLRGETIELKGEALNHKGKTRQASAKIEPTNDSSGKIKVRINAGGTKLIFNGTYRFLPHETKPPP